MKGLQLGATRVIWPRKPVLTPAHEREFEKVGIDEVRRFLASSTGQNLYISHGPPSSEAKAWVSLER